MGTDVTAVMGVRSGCSGLMSPFCRYLTLAEHCRSNLYSAPLVIHPDNGAGCNDKKGGAWMAAKRPRRYKPTEKEAFMNAKQKTYFKLKLLEWRDELLAETSETIRHLQEDTSAQPDIADRASAETDRAIELRTRDRERKLISKIDEALRRIDEGTYGYCEETGEPIGVKRLEARPIATLSLEAQERHERRERVYRDD
jgi:DnaK suppressor protein